MRMCSRRVMEEFSVDYPQDYPEPETVARLLRKKYKVREIPVVMRERSAGTSSINPAKSVYSVRIKVSLAILVERLEKDITVKTRIILIVIFLIGLFLAVNSVRKKKMQLKYALPWILCSIVLMIFAGCARTASGTCRPDGNLQSGESDLFPGLHLLPVYCLCSIHHHLQNIRPTPAAGAVGGADGETVYGGGARRIGCAYG